MIPVRLKFKSIEDFLKTHSSDTALAGIFVATAIRVDAGTEVLLTIDIEGEDNLETQAIVHWYRDAQGRHEAGVGLRFVRPPSVLRRLIASASASDTVSASISADNSLTKKIGAGGGVHNSVTLQTTDTHRLRRPIADHQLDEPEIDVEVTADELGDIPILGIDLGTSNSCAAIARGDQVHVVDLSGDNRSGSRAIPSVVFFPEEGSVLIGAKARAHQKKSPARTIFGSKRFVGRRYHHPDVQALLSRYPYKIVPGRGEQCAISLGGRIINLVTVSSKILGLIKERSEASLGRSIDQAVVTVPAHFNQNQRQAIVQAGKLAGLEVARIINEPTAAAIAYGLTYDKPATIIVYDLGGGTFDVSVMKIGPPNLTVLATGGDTFLGGEDFDQVIVDYVVRRYHAENRHGAKLSTNHIAVTKLKIEAEKVKCLLTTEAEAVFSVPDADLVGGGTDAVSIIIRRRDVEGLVEPLVTRTLKISDMVLRQAGLEASEIDDVLLVGGQTAMPCVAARVGKHFRRKPRCDLAADEVVALGAAMLSVISITSEMRLQDILSMSIGIHAGGGNFHKLIEANTPLPHRTTFRFTIPRADLQTRQLDVFQGESPQIIRNEKLGSVGFQKFAADTTDPVPLEVELLLSPDCLLRVRITNRATDEVLDELLSTKDSD